jgi:hypothetical protein
MLVIAPNPDSKPKTSVPTTMSLDIAAARVSGTTSASGNGICQNAISHTLTMITLSSARGYDTT